MLGLTPDFWRGRSVFITGHTGFKGGWLAVWLHLLGARVHGYALAPATRPALFDVARVGEVVAHRIGDVRDLAGLAAALADARPEVIFHLAAQPLVREGYREPVATFSTNVMGTVNLLEAVRSQSSVRAVIVVTSDKCYANRESGQPYREGDALGGRDPYSGSKACAEIVTAAWRESFLRGSVGIASARAGNVIGGGDWADDRLVPDALRAWEKGSTLQVRYPGAVRPWQHVLEPLHGYLLLAEHLVAGGAAEAWNFGPDDRDMVPVGELLDQLAACWGVGAAWCGDRGDHPHEAGLLHLDSAKARSGLGWRPRWRLDHALGRVVAWHRAYLAGADVRRQCESDILDYQASR
jgi:CDP-glucose 4,6-dehydratase